VIPSGQKVVFDTPATLWPNNDATTLPTAYLVMYDLPDVDQAPCLGANIVVNVQGDTSLSPTT
jgi:hypothetical protein